MVGSLIGTAADTFTFDAATIAAVSPTNGLYIGVTPVTITGNNFGSGAVAKIGGTSCTKTTFVTATSVTCEAPAPSDLVSVATGVEVIVDSTTSSLASAFSYNAPNTGLAGTTAAALTVGGATVIQIDNATVFHAYKVGGVLTLGGSLSLIFADGYTPSRTKCFEIFQATSIAGAFASTTTNLLTATTQTCSTATTYGVKVTVPGCETLYKDCSGHGTCDQSSGDCACVTGYSGSACDSACWYNKTAGAFDCTCGAKLPAGDAAS